MENIRIFWWVVVITLLFTTVGCSTQGIQPNPIYRVVNKRVAITRHVSSRVSTISATASLFMGLIFGGFIYWMCLCMCCEKCE